MKAKTVFSSLLLGVLLLVGCSGMGGGGTTGGNPTPDPVITGVSVTCNPVAILDGQTSQCGATVKGTGNINPNVTWSVAPGPGTVNSNGLFTSNGVGAVKIVATAVGNTSVTGSATVTVNPASTITGVSVQCNPSTVVSGQTSQCAATVSGTGSFNPSVTWSTGSNGGAIDQAGLFTPPSTPGTYTAIATSVQDNTKTASATVTVNPVAAITGVSPMFGFINDQNAPSPVFQFTGSGFVAGMSATANPVAPGVLTVQDANNFTFTTRFDQRLSFGDYSLQVCPNGICLAPFSFGVMSNREQGMFDPKTGNGFYQDPASGLIYAIDPAGNVTSFHAGGFGSAALDDVSGSIYAANGLGGSAMQVLNQNGTPVGGGNTASPVLMVLAGSGFGCGIQPTNNSVECHDQSDTLFVQPIMITGLNDPCAGVIKQGSLVVGSCGGTNLVLARVDLATNAKLGSLAISGLQQGTSLTTGVQIVALSNGTVGVISPVANLLVGVDLASMKEMWRVKLPTSSYRVIADESVKGFTVAYAVGPQAFPVALVQYDSLTGTKSSPTKTFNNSVPAGLYMKLDGTLVGWTRNGVPAN